MTEIKTLDQRGRVLLALIVGIHHATVKEDKQVIIDSHENSLR